MPAGALRESVTFQRQAEGADDGRGNKRQAFANLADAVEVPAQLEPLRFGEVVMAEGVQGRRLYRVTLRYTDVLAGIGVSDRMLNARTGVVFNVKSPPVNKDGKRKYLELLVETGGASG